MCTKVAEVTHREYDSGCRKRREKKKCAKLGAVTPDYVGRATERKKKKRAPLHDENAIHLVFLLVVAISTLRVVTVKNLLTRETLVSGFQKKKKKRNGRGKKPSSTSWKSFPLLDWFCVAQKHCTIPLISFSVNSYNVCIRVRARFILSSVLVFFSLSFISLLLLSSCIPSAGEETPPPSFES